MTDRPSSARRSRGILEGGAPFRGGPILNLPTPIGPIVVYTGIAFFLSLILPSPFSSRFLVEDFAFIPARFLSLIENGEYLIAAVPLFTHIFLHGSIGHLVINMLWLMVFGSGVARRLCVESATPGDATRNVFVFLGFYITCGVVGALTHFAAHPIDATPMVGASGAISGLMAGTLRFALRLFAPMGAEYGRLAPVWARPVMIASLIYIGLNVATGVGQAMMANQAVNIAWEAHIGGFLGGLLLFPVFDRMAKRPPLPFGLG
ncbi:MAG: rhomboid family intramembrane serine protease [Pseudomonadota bacterium]